jgi:hypothetical protein
MVTPKPQRLDLSLGLEDEDEEDISSIVLRTPTFKSEELRTPRFDLDESFGELPELLPMMTSESSEVRRLDPPPGVDRAVIQQMLHAFSADDHATALDLAEMVLATNPELVVVQSCAKECRLALVGAHLRRIGGPEGVLLVAGTATELTAAGITHREGFLLSQIDGVISNEELLDVCGMEGDEALRILAKLVGLGIVCQA